MPDNKKNAYIQKFQENLLSGISYYRSLTEKVSNEFSSFKDKIEGGLDEAEAQLNKLIQANHQFC